MRILCVGAHPDDVETGAGGFITKMKKDCENKLMVVVFSNCEEQKGNEGIAEEFNKSMQTFGIDNFRLLDFPNTRLPEHAAEIRTELEKIRDGFSPSMVVTHNMNSTHQDHKTLAEACIRVFRDSSILMYEELKSTPKFVPNMFISLAPEEIENKVKALECYKSQFRRYYFNMDYVRSLAHVRGKPIRKDFAEAFEVYQYVW